MGGQLKEQKLQDIAFARDQNDQVPVVSEARRTVFWRSKQPLALCGKPVFVSSLHKAIQRCLTG